MRIRTVSNSAFASWALNQKGVPVIQWGDRPLLPMKAASIVSDLAAFACLALLILILLAIPWVAGE